MTDQKKIDEARKLFEEQEIAQGRSVEMTSCGEYLDGVVFFGWLNELDRIDAEYAQAQKAAEQCETMQRPKSECGCPDCGSSLIDCPETEPAPAQDEREAYSVWRDSNVQKGRTDTNGYHAFKAGAAWQRTRPAQAEQQPIRMPSNELEAVLDEARGVRDLSDVAHGWYEATECVARLNAAPIAQTAPQPEQSGLVEALEKISRIAGDSINYHPSHMSRIAREALAAYRAALSAQGQSNGAS